MRKRLVCPECMKLGDELNMVLVTLSAERWMTTQCEAGHQLGLILQASGWALVFERALRSLADKRARDAAVDASLALEMYFAEVPVRARYDREPGTSPRVLRQELALAVRGSDRAIAAARATISLVGEAAPPTWDEALVARVREGIVTQSHYPTEAEAEALCVEVGRTILAFEAVLDARPCAHAAPFRNAVWLEEAEEFRAAHPTASPVFVAGGDPFDREDADAPISVEARIAQYRAAAAHPS